MSAVVLLAGMNCSADLWTDCELEDAIPVELTFPSIDAQVDSLLDRLPDRFVLGGLSLGGIVAMALTIRAPERVAGLILAATNAKAPTDAQRQGWKEWLSSLDSGASARELQSGILPALLTPASRTARPDLVERTLGMGDATGEATLRSQLLMQGTRTDLRPALAGMTTPTLVVCGLQDGICPPGFHTELVSWISGAHLETLDAGHLLPMEKPAEFGSLLRNWVAHAVE